MGLCLLRTRHGLRSLCTASDLLVPTMLQRSACLRHFPPTQSSSCSGTNAGVLVYGCIRNFRQCHWTRIRLHQSSSILEVVCHVHLPSTIRIRICARCFTCTIRWRPEHGLDVHWPLYRYSHSRWILLGFFQASEWHRGIDKRPWEQV